MKKQMLIILLSACCGCMSETRTPEPVRNAFNAKFPGQKAEKWEKENGDFEASFSQDGKQKSVVFDKSGNWKETETEMAADNLLPGIKEYIQKNYPGSEVKEATLISTPSGIQFEAEVNGQDLVFDANGDFLEMKKGGEDKD